MRRALLVALSFAALFVAPEAVGAADAPDVRPTASSSPPVRAEQHSQPRGEAYLWGLTVPFGVVNNSLSNGFSQVPSLGARFAVTYPAAGQMVMVAGQFYETAANHSARTLGDPPVLIPPGTDRYDSEDARVGVQLPRTGLYAALSTLYLSPPEPLSTVPDLVGLGIGLEALPDMHRSRSFFGKFYYYPNLEAEDLYNDPVTGAGLFVRYSQLSYEFGVAQRIGGSRGFLTASVGGDTLKKLSTLPAQFPGSAKSVLLSLGYAFRVWGGR